jgi:hypothetical protein
MTTNLVSLLKLNIPNSYVPTIKIAKNSRKNNNLMMIKEVTVYKL